MKKIICVPLIVLLCLPTLLSAQDMLPVVKLNPQYLPLRISDASADRAGKYILTVSENKSALLWDAHSYGNLIREFSHPVGPDLEGALTSCALSPDGKMALIAGHTGYTWNRSYSAYLFDTESGELVKRVSGLQAPVAHSVFSPDGTYLYLALKEHSILVYNTTDWNVVFEDDKNFRDAWISGLKVAGNNSFAVLKAGTEVFMYSDTFQLTRRKKYESDKPGRLSVYDMDLSPDGNNLAIYLKDGIHIVSTKNFKTKRLIVGDNWGLCFSDDGSKLITSRESYIMRTYDLETGNFKEYQNIIEDEIPDWHFQALPDGRIFTYSNCAMSVMKDGEVLFFVDRPATFDNLWSGTFNIKDKDGKKVEVTAVTFANGFEYKSVGVINFDIESRNYIYEDDKFTVISSFSEDPEFSQFNDDLISGTLEFTPNERRPWSRELTMNYFTAKLAENRQVIVAALPGGIIKWFRARDGEELLTLYMHPDLKRWVLWTPQGYYDCSIGGDDLIGWQVNNGLDKAADFYPASRFREIYYRPDIINLVLVTHDVAEAEEKAIKSAQISDTINALYGEPSTPILHKRAIDIRQALPPMVTILSPADNSVFTDENITIRYRIKNADMSDPGAVKIYIDGRPEEQTRAVKRVGELVEVTLPRKDCTVELIAHNQYGPGSPASISLRWGGETVVDKFKPHLYVLAIGVNDYPHLPPSMQLNFATKDAEDFAGVLRGSSSLYNHVDVKILTNESASRSSILDAFDWIRRETTSNDVAMIYVAGHGINDENGNFFYIPHDGDSERLRATCINKSEILQTVSNIAGKVIFFIDACHSGSILKGTRGQADINSIVNELISTENGAVVFSSCTGNQVSREHEEWNNGAFTKALVEGLEGKAIYDESNVITVKSLDYYVSRRVKALTDGKQSPVMESPSAIPDFPIFIPR